jgi:acetyl esterase/lipase
VINFPYKDFDKIIDCDIKGKKTTEESIKVKLYSNIKIIHRKKNETDIFVEDPLNPLNKTRNAIIIHIHGGGFVAMSPSSH